MEQKNGEARNLGTPHYGRTNNVGGDGASIGIDRTQYVHPQLTLLQFTFPPRVSHYILTRFEDSSRTP